MAVSTASARLRRSAATRSRWDSRTSTSTPCSESFATRAFSSCTSGPSGLVFSFANRKRIRATMPRSSSCSSLSSSNGSSKWASCFGSRSSQVTVIVSDCEGHTATRKPRVRTMAAIAADLLLSLDMLGLPEYHPLRFSRPRAKRRRDSGCGRVCPALWSCRSRSSCRVPNLR